jgi:hypothetical protein
MATVDNQSLAMSGSMLAFVIPRQSIGLTTLILQSTGKAFHLTWTARWSQQKAGLGFLRWLHIDPHDKHTSVEVSSMHLAAEQQPPLRC